MKQSVKTPTFEAELNNNKMERLNGEIRDREKTVRGIKKSNSPLLQGYQLYHNYLREHQGLAGKTPAEVAGIRIGAPIFALPVIGDITDAIIIGLLYHIAKSKVTIVINATEFIPFIGDFHPTYTISTLLWILNELHKRQTVRKHVSSSE